MRKKVYVLTLTNSFIPKERMSGVIDSLYHSGVGWFNDILEVCSIEYRNIDKYNLNK